MNTTVDELKTLYVKFGGNLADVEALKTDAELIDKIEDILHAVPQVLILPESASATLFGKTVSQYQTDVNVIDNVIVGSLSYLDAGEVVDAWGAGNFIALKFVIIDPDITFSDIKVGLNPSHGGGLVSLDADLNGVFKITDKTEQIFRVEVTKDGVTKTSDYVLSGLTVATE